ncbi:19180_t:CDS:2 [Rhizophagus irregularis]|nr:19180_t:CDS:2 [Rhizophagus irregularis]
MSFGKEEVKYDDHIVQCTSTFEARQFAYSKNGQQLSESMLIAIFQKYVKDHEWYKPLTT